MAAGSENNGAQVPTAFSAAASLGFKLIFSFDYAGNGPWEKADVISMLNTYGHHAAYFQHGGSKPLVSTFEGPDNADDWHDIKAATGCFLIPDWSSLGAQPAVGLANGVADGLFSWNAWPYGAGRADTYDAAAYGSFLDGRFSHSIPCSYFTKCCSRCWGKALHDGCITLVLHKPSRVSIDDLYT